MDNIVYNETRTACLKQHSIQPFNLAKDSESPAVELYASKFADFRALPGKYDKEVIKALSAVLKANEMDEKERFKIYMIPNYDRFFNEMSMLVKLNFSQGFADKLCTIVAKPIIRIVWKIQTVGYPNGEKVHDGGNLDVPLKAGQFSHEIQGFGSSDVGINVSKFSFIYSVILEWKEFYIGTMGSQGHCIRPNLEEKLWNEMPLADCTIVSFSVLAKAARKNKSLGELANPPTTEKEQPKSIISSPAGNRRLKIQESSRVNEIKQAEANLEIPFKAGESLSGIQGFDFYVSKLLFNYSVMLEWQESSRSSQGYHYRRPNLEEKLWNEMLLADCTIVSSDGTENKCHRNVLAVHSDVLHTMLKTGLSEVQTNRIETVDISQEGVTILLAYMYGRDLELDHLKIEVACEVLKATHKYQISSLKALLLDMFRRKPSDLFSIDNLVTIYFFSVNVSEYKILSEKMLLAMKK
ncbi:unnamed protein product [Orchesella dallaii]|uniref:BTB domain-containing protein n=1 Tax=Orchesella dallaii TaxID=48710 RepID=A0ABP1RU93_9HEXA